MNDAKCGRTIADTENQCKMDPGTFFRLRNTIDPLDATIFGHYCPAG